MNFCVLYIDRPDPPASALAGHGMIALLGHFRCPLGHWSLLVGALCFALLCQSVSFLACVDAAVPPERPTFCPTRTGYGCPIRTNGVRSRETPG